jgi:hypothetical protein
MPSNPATGQSKHVAVLTQKMGNKRSKTSGGIDEGVEDYDAEWDHRRRPAHAAQARVGSSSWRDEATLPPRRGESKKGGKGSTQLDHLADMVYDALMCNTTAQRRHK